MKKYSLFALLLAACAAIVVGQGGFNTGQSTPIYTSAVDPSGNCTVQAVSLISSNSSQKLFQCNQSSGVWQSIAGSGINCGSSATCAAPTALAFPLKYVTGTAAMSSGTSVAITGISPAFTSATSYSCSVSNAAGHAYTSGAEIISSSAVTLVSGTSNSDTWIYVCTGY